VRKWVPLSILKDVTEVHCERSSEFRGRWMKVQILSFHFVSVNAIVLICMTDKQRVVGDVKDSLCILGHSWRSGNIAATAVEEEAFHSGSQ
jgi:hypothetical protein